ncbi:hypothetical protein [Desulfosediminicola flagellatus]|uniref:hypothetical protein n=1 Tax=Desulfosediminicola flagellatus TaxID=2569541 RepID=UPI00142EC8D1|nr:hypothetical protein [Desulfosediminicola flagellatus]
MVRQKPFHILVADMNHHVSALLKRELDDNRFSVTTLDNGIELYHSMLKPDQYDMVIFDPQLLWLYGNNLLQTALDIALHERIKVILHTYEGQFTGLAIHTNISRIVKSDSSILAIKKRVYDIFLVGTGNQML